MTRTMRLNYESTMRLSVWFTVYCLILRQAVQVWAILSDSARHSLFKSWNEWNSTQHLMSTLKTCGNEKQCHSSLWHSCSWFVILQHSQTCSMHTNFISVIPILCSVHQVKQSRLWYFTWFEVTVSESKTSCLSLSQVVWPWHVLTSTDIFRFAKQALKQYRVETRGQITLVRDT